MDNGKLKVGEDGNVYTAFSAELLPKVVNKGWQLLYFSSNI